MTPPPLPDHFPRIKHLTGEAVLARAEADRLAQQLADLGCLSPGEIHSPSPRIAELDRQRRRCLQRARHAWQEIERLGAEVIDRQLGLVDLPAILDGRPVTLCWQLGEDTLCHWHLPSEPCRSRRRWSGSEPPAH